MSGYNGYSKSNNAVEAEKRKCYPASVCAKKLNVPIEFIKSQLSYEWHHTSNRFNVTKYYNIEDIKNVLSTNEGIEELNSIKNKMKNKMNKSEIVYSNVVVTWLEWSGTRSHPTAKEVRAIGTVVDRGNFFVDVKLDDGTSFKKGRKTIGFKVYQNGKRII